MTTEELPDRSGTLLAERYRLVKRLGAGGMGEVYRARNELVGRDVAIKVLKPAFAQSPDVVARVLREARAANAVRHPNVVDVLDVATDEHGAPVIVQELLDGHDLGAQMTSRGRALSEAEALDLMIPVVEAVGAAHAAGIMHRDLKPENVFLHRRSDGAVVPKVLDFGLSRAVGENAVTRLTATGVSMGTPLYMSPEQVQGQRDIDQRTDVWALGVMLYEMVSGQCPFLGESMGAVFVKICTEDPAPLPPTLSDMYRHAVARCLQRDRNLRPQDANALAAELRAARPGATTAVDGTSAAVLAHAQTMHAVSGSGFGTSPTLSSPNAVNPRDALSIGPAVSAIPLAAKRRAPLVALAAVAVCALVGGGAWLATRDGATAPTADLHAAVPPSAAPLARTTPAAPATTVYEAPAAHPAAPPTPAVGTTAYDTPSAPSPRVTPPATAYEPAQGSRRSRRGRRARAATATAHAAGQAPATSVGGTSRYDDP